MWRVAGWLAPLVLAFAAYLTVQVYVNPGTTGDEPHYLLVAESIAFDGDVDMRNDYASRERTLRVVNVFPLDYNVQAAVYKDSGELRPLHGVGVSALLAPAVGLWGLTGARVAMVLIAALLAHQLYFLLADLRLRRRYRIAAWIAVAFCMPVLPFVSQIYPELPGALLVVVVLRIILRRTTSPWALALGSLASAALFWLHVRYFPISFALLAGLMYVATSDHAGDTTLRERLKRHFVAARERWRTTTLPVLAPYALVLASFVALFQHWYGSPDPRTPYYAYSTTTLGGGGLQAVYDYALHDLFNPLVGWIPFAPVHWLGLAALGCVVVWFGWPAVACIAVIAAYELSLASSAPVGGWGLPARYLLIVIPLVAVPIAVAIQQIRLARVVFVPLLAGSLVLAVAAVRDFGGLYPAGERQTIVGLRSIAPAFPVTLPARPLTDFTLSPGQHPPQAGRVQGPVVVAREGGKRGFMLWGPFATLKTGAYQATYSLSAAGAGPDTQVAVIEAIGGNDRVLAREIVSPRQLHPRRLTEVELPFSTPGDLPIQTRVFYLGQGTVRAGPVQVRSIAPEGLSPAPAHLRDWPLAFLWVGGTLLIGALFVQVMKPRS